MNNKLANVQKSYYLAIAGIMFGISAYFFCMMRSNIVDWVAYFMIWTLTLFYISKEEHYHAR